MKKLNVKPVEELSQFINEANTPGNLLQDAPDFDAIKQEEYENEGTRQDVYHPTTGKGNGLLTNMTSHTVRHPIIERASN